jgi:hypothetical protein
MLWRGWQSTSAEVLKEDKKKEGLAVMEGGRLPLECLEGCAKFSFRHPKAVICQRCFPFTVRPGPELGASHSASRKIDSELVQQ